MAKQLSLLKADELLKLGFGQNRHAKFLGFVVFGAGVGADDDVVGFFADGAAELAAMLLDEFAGFFAAAAFEGAGEDEGFSGEFLALDFAFLGGWADSSGLQLFDQLTIGGLAEEFDNGFADLRAYLGDFFQILGFGVRQFFQRTEILGEQLSCAFADETYSKSVNQARKRVLLAGGDFIQ